MKKLLQLLKKDERGLTLVELLAVIVILAIVGAIAFVAIGNVTENSKKDAHVANAQQVISAAKLAEASGEIVIDTKGTKALTLSTIELITDPWSKEEYKEDEVIISKNDEGDYLVTLPTKTGNNDCKLTSVPESEINKGRKSACDFGITNTDG